MGKSIAKFLAYFVVTFVIAFVFCGLMVLIWWAAQHGFWWSLAGTAFAAAFLGAVLFAIKDPAKVGKAR